MATAKSSTRALVCALPMLILLITSSVAMDEMKKKVTQIEFYMHDIVKGKNVTAVTVTKGPPQFGMIRVIDDSITEGPSHKSKELGRGRGMYAQDSLQGVNLMLVFTVMFQAGEHNGSTLSMLGQDNTMDKQREIAVVGGTGHFRHATGHAILESQAVFGLNAVLKFNVTVLH